MLVLLLLLLSQRYHQQMTARPRAFLDSRTVGGASVPLSDPVLILGVTFDCHLTMKYQVLSLVRSANFELRHISCIRHLLSTDATKILVTLVLLLFIT